MLVLNIEWKVSVVCLRLYVILYFWVIVRLMLLYFFGIDRLKRFIFFMLVMMLVGMLFFFLRMFFVGMSCFWMKCCIDCCSRLKDLLLSVMLLVFVGYFG